MAEYLAQIFGGIPMNQSEFVRLSDLGLTRDDIDSARSEAVDRLIDEGADPAKRSRLVELVREARGTASVGDPGLDETLEAVRNEMRRFADAEVIPHAHEWHLKNDYIPLEIIDKMSELGVFGLTIPEEFGGLGLGKESMATRRPDFVPDRIPPRSGQT